MKALNTKIACLPIANHLKGYLSNEVVQRKHSFYINLFDYLLPAFKNITESDQENLTWGGYLYFRFLLEFDNFLDTKEENPIKLSQYLSDIMDLQELAIRELSVVFNRNSPFWEMLNQRKSQYKQAIIKEKIFSKDRKPFTEEFFQELASGKSAVCYAAIDALATLNDAQVDREVLETCLKHIHIAFQYLDDIDDFRKDDSEKQWTYPHYLVEEYLKKNQKHAEDVNIKQKYLYLSGTAYELLDNVRMHYHIAMKIAVSTRLIGMEKYIENQIAQVIQFKNEISFLLEKTHYKSIHSNTLNNTLFWENGISLGIDFLYKKLNDGVWTDFMTSAGRSETWVSCFIGLMVANSDFKKEQLQSVFSHISDNTGAYNNHIIADGDSTNFLIAFYAVLGKSIPPELLRNWMSYQNTNGGWKTYNNALLLQRHLKIDDTIGVNGWTQSHPCVSATAAYILTFFPNLTEQYEHTCRYLEDLIIHRKLSSYWWTSNVYTYSFAIRAFAKNHKYNHLCDLLGIWILEGQNKDGFWENPINNQPNVFYTAMALQGLLSVKSQKYEKAINSGIKWLLYNQTTDGSWQTDRILRIPATNVINPKDIHRWRNSSFGVNCLVDDHNRVFTTSAVINALVTYKMQGGCLLV